MIKVIDTGSNTAQNNMDTDSQLLKSLEESPILHFYEWSSPSATYGYFTDPSKHLNMRAIESNGIQLARRPTGGGIIFHLTDFAFSFLMPSSHPHFSQNTLENYKYVNSIVLKAISQKGNPTLQSNSLHNSPKFCMANPTVFDVMVHGKKVGGAAQRRTKKGYLHQGSILLSMPSESFLQEVLLEKDVLEAMKSNSFPLQIEISEAKNAIRSAFQKHLAG